MNHNSDFEKENIFSFLTKVCINYTCSIVSLTIISLMVGDEAKEISTLFSLGSSGMPISNLIIFLVLSILITGIRWLLFTTSMFKNLSLFIRSILLLLLVGFLMSAAIFCFDWFPPTMWQPWAAFILCYLSFTLISIGIVIIKNKIENKNYEEGLKKYLEEQEINRIEK